MTCSNSCLIFASDDSYPLESKTRAMQNKSSMKNIRQPVLYEQRRSRAGTAFNKVLIETGVSLNSSKKYICFNIINGTRNYF